MATILHILVDRGGSLVTLCSTFAAKLCTSDPPPLPFYVSMTLPCTLPTQTVLPPQAPLSDKNENCHSPCHKRHCNSITVSPTSVREPLVASSDLRGIVGTPMPAMPDAFVNKPAKDTDAIKARSLMAQNLYRIYAEFVQAGNFMFTDIFDKSGLLTSPMEDPMGVVTAAVSIMRAFYPEDQARDVLEHGQFMSLDIETRHYMAGALFLAYKAKSEDSWKNGMMTRAVLSRFVTEIEYPTKDSHLKMAPLVVQAEKNILMELPTLSIVDANLHSVIEVQLAYLNQGPKPILSSTASLAVLSCYGRYFHLLTAITDTELLEELCAEFGSADVGMAFVELGVASMHGAQTFEDTDLPDNRLRFNCNSSICALRMLEVALKTGFDKSYKMASPHIRQLISHHTLLAAQSCLKNALHTGTVSKLW